MAGAKTGRKGSAQEPVGGLDHGGGASKGAEDAAGTAESFGRAAGGSSGPEQLEEGSLAEKSIEELLDLRVARVVSASKRLERVTEAPASVTIITAEEIRRYGWRTLADVLRSVRGFHISYDRYYNYVGVQGFSRTGDYNSRILLLLDGHRLNEPIYEGAYVESGLPIDLDLVSRVEIIRGPGSAVYGTNAFAGVVNLISKSADELANEGRQREISLEAGSRGMQRVRFSGGRQFSNGISFVGNVTGFRANGLDQFPVPEFDQPGQSPFVTPRNSDREAAGQAFAALHYKDFYASLGFSQRRKNLAALWEGQPAEATRNFGIDTRGFLQVGVRKKLGETGGLHLRVFGDEYRFAGVTPYAMNDPLLPSTIEHHERAKSIWWGGEVQWDQQWASVNELTVGVDFRIIPRLTLSTYDVNPFIPYGNTRTSLSNYGLFAENVLSLGNAWKVISGARVDDYSSFGRTFNPRAGVIFSPNRRTAFKALIGTAFRAPNPFELNYDTPSYLANPNLQPEKTATSEAVWEQYWGANWRSSLSVFHSRYSNLIGQQENSENLVEYMNSGRLSGNGFAGELAYSQKDGWDFLVSYSYQNLHYPNSSLPVTNSPHHLFKLRLSRPLGASPFVLGGELQGTSAAATVHGDAYAKAYYWPSLTVSSRRLQQRMELAFSVYNLANARYFHPIGDEWGMALMRQDPRSFRVQLTLRP